LPMEGTTRNLRSLHSSRSKRKILGAVVRPDKQKDEVGSHISQKMSVQAEELCAVKHLNAGSALSSPKHLDAGSAVFSSKQQGPAPKGPRRSSRGATKKPTATAYRLDLADDSDPEERAPPSRMSSLTRGYDALGTTLHSMHDKDEPHDHVFSTCYAEHADWKNLSLFSSSGLTLQGTSSFISQGSSRPRNRSVSTLSAMEMDLGDDGTTKSRLSGMNSSMQLRPGSSMSMEGSRSMSTGSLSIHKSKGKLEPLPMTQGKSSLLPSVSSTMSPAGSVAWSVHMAKSAKRRSGLASIF